MNSDHYRTLTQRIELNLVSAVYDPIGLVAAYTVKTQLLLKDVWQLSGQYWDDHLPDHIVDKFVEWIDELTKLTEITFLRSNFDGQAEQVELHIFGNISRDVFSSVAFLRVKMTIGSRSRTELAFVFGKARVAPMKPLTIPKLELQAALLAARLRKEIQLAFTIPIERTFMWTDTTTVIQWLQSTDKFLVFVANRLAEILESTTTDECNYVQTSENPADVGSHGLSTNVLSESPWLKGPDIFKTDDLLFQQSTDVLQKIKKNKSESDQVPSEHEKQEATAITRNVANIAWTFEWQKHSSYEEFMRTVAYMLRLMPKFACNRTKIGSITDPAELEVAHRKLFPLLQDESIYLESKSLQKSPNNQRDFNITQPLSLYWTEWTTSRNWTYPDAGNCYIWNKTSCDTWCSKSIRSICSWSIYTKDFATTV